MDWLRKSFGGVGSHVGNTAGVGKFESDESALSPAGSPGVLDSPVISGGSNKKDTVVEGSSAVAENSTLVGRPVGGIDGNGDGSTSELVSEIADASTLNIREASDLVITFATFASSVLGSVGISTLESNSLGNDVFEGTVHKTTVAALISVGSGAVNEFLLREALGGASETPEAFKTTGGRESPA